jgi:hypothetical protein
MHPHQLLMKVKMSNPVDPERARDLERGRADNESWPLLEYLGSAPIEGLHDH